MIKHRFAFVAAGALLAAGTAFASSAFAQSSVTTTTIQPAPAPMQQQTTIQLTPQQEEQVYTTITKEQVAVQPPPPSWTPSVGVAVPESVQLYSVPSSVEVPSVRTERYTVVNGHVVLVDPATRQVTKIIQR
jgi:hypothetical protein